MLPSALYSRVAWSSSCAGENRPEIRPGYNCECRACKKSSAIDDGKKTYSLKIVELLRSFCKGTSQKLEVQTGKSFTVGMDGTSTIMIQTVRRCLETH